MKARNAWHNSPLRSRIIFLLAVFFVFTGCGIAYDCIHMGRQAPLPFAVLVVISALFSTSYAAAGIILRSRFWKAFLPLFVLHSAVMTLLANWFPEGPVPVQLNAAETSLLHARLTFDGIAITVSVILGYIGFIIVSISEGRRYIRTQTEKASLESEMAAAREVQRLMVPADLPSIAGYTVASAYRPAAEVGGDFFQVIPLPSGSTLVIIGDVSGKGLPAAMIVSMIVGMLCALSGFTEEPAQILTGLNRRLCGRTHGGFVTCLAVRLDPEGHLTLGNAGHLPPYLNGAEIPFAGSMPLGFIETAAYEQSTIEMRAGDRVVLLTDGIVEARNQQGELLGFPRVQSLLREGATAAVVADTAQHHGQDDDLTVIAIART